MTDIIVLGAGMVGVSTALALQARGHQVTLIDRRGPGEETSYGNAGMIQAEAAEPYALPLYPGTLIKIALGRSNDVNLRFKGILSWIEPAARYAFHSLPNQYRKRVVGPWAEMILSATRDHARLIDAAGAQDLVRQDGFRQAYRTASAFNRAVEAANRYQTDYGIPSNILDGAALQKAEPALRVTLAGAVHWTSAWSCQDPGGLVKRYANLFEANGGQIARGDAMTLRRQAKSWQLDSEAGVIAAERVVVCLGPWSPALLARFGHRIPMVYKRGYHRHFAARSGPSIPIMDVETGTFMAPMRQGLRVLTGAELNRMGSEPDYRQITRSTEAARELFDLGEPVEKDPWQGTRPCLPGMLPMIGPSRQHDGLWFNFGHGHQGFTLGPTTARLLADQMDRR